MKVKSQRHQSDINISKNDIWTGKYRRTHVHCVCSGTHSKCEKKKTKKTPRFYISNEPWSRAITKFTLRTLCRAGFVLNQVLCFVWLHLWVSKNRKLRLTAAEKKGGGEDHKTRCDALRLCVCCADTNVWPFMLMDGKDDDDYRFDGCSVVAYLVLCCADSV